MEKHGQDQPKKHVPTMKGLEEMANSHPDADVDTRYQDNKGKKGSKKGEDKNTNSNIPST
ncbi:MAG: hypothetical protein V4539_13735 [Bacteroidota bacterium]